MIFLLCTSNGSLGGDFAKVMRFTGSNIELNASNLEIGSLFEDSSPELEERHEELLLDELEPGLLCYRVKEVLNYGVYVAEYHNIFKLIHTTQLVS